VTAIRRGARPVDTQRTPRAVWQTLALGDVKIEGGLWAKRQKVNGVSALPHGFRMLEAAGNLENLRIAAGRANGTYRGPVFMDSDVYKWLEAAAYEVARVPSDSLRATMDTAIDLVEAAQGNDGYLNSYYQVAEPGQRWTDFAHGHELYCAGHLFQAAVAYHRAAGDERLLGIARRFADYIDGVFGPGRRNATPGHPEIEMALVELYRETGERRYLDLAGFFVDQRGHGWLGPGRYNSSAYYQDRVPVREATELEGHAVRALYLTTGIADLYLETGDAAFLKALEQQWSDLVSHKLYITGGIGARHLAEAFGQPYELPNESAYCETCAAIASIQWNWRMLLATGQSRFADLIERTLYNAVLGGVSLDGERYFYVNPLASNGEPEHLSRGGCRRKEWHRVACCPPNVMRLVASLGHYVATRTVSGLQIHQYVPARIVFELAPGQTVAVRMEGTYPWEGRIRLTVEEGSDAPWTLGVRVPAWCEGAANARVNGMVVSPAVGTDGYLHLGQTWAGGDVVEIELPMRSRLIEAHPQIESTRGCVAIERGPLVFCLEQADHPGLRVNDLEIEVSAPLTSNWHQDLLDGVTVVRGTGFEVDAASWNLQLYRPWQSGKLLPRKRVDLQAIPYFAWANREAGAMRVWIPRALERSGAR
jgi:DUF1680 family protein